MKQSQNSYFLYCALTVSLVLTAFGASADSPPEITKACSSEAQRQFDFWLGEWQVKTPDGKIAGTNSITARLGSCVLHESWKGAGGSIGESFSMYFARGGNWHQTWVDANGGRLDLSGGLEDGKMVLSGEMPGTEGKKVLHRITWTPQKDGTVVQEWKSTADQEKTWQTLFKGIYSRQ